ncbi:MAG: carboxypeptidase regulatory-like domain-containing protein [Bacteroidota bacterium]
MKKLIILLVLFSNTILAQEDKKTANLNPADLAKTIVAKQYLYAGNFANALSSFREIEKSNPNHDGTKYYIGLCYFNIGQPEKAKENLLAGLALNNKPDNECHFLLGKIYHYESALDKAIQEFKTFITSGKPDAETIEDCKLFLSQCETAQVMMSNPWNVVINNMGIEINSKYDDKNPCITTDGKSLVFTSRRPESATSPLDVEGDGKYFENVFIAHPDSSTRQFLKANTIPGSLNSAAHDACTSISPDGKLIYVYKNDVNDKASRGGNIFVSKALNGKWRMPESLGKSINSTYWEGGACISPDGKKIFFTSERPGGQGKSDIWMIEKINKKEWGKPVNLGSDINSPEDEGGIFLAPDGKTLFFCSNGPKSMGSYDIFKSVFEYGRWNTPVNVGFPINSVGKEGQFTIGADAQVAYFSSDRLGGLGESDLYQIELKEYAILEKDGQRKTNNGLCILKGTIREGFEGYGVPDVEIILSDEQGKMFASTFSNEIGEYFFTIPDGKYSIHIKKSGYKENDESIELKANSKETLIYEKGYLLKK